ncbi:MAG: PhnD/SsuA/transferrin family substrate-binding protein [Ignavibacteriae bacterium]|nr:PhnD/SsuA/transferrin family substrate-binding protein [Ignavibacteriota bacterium]
MIKIKHIFLLLLLQGFSSSFYSQSGLKSEYVYGISNEIFEGVNVRDAKASLELWAKVFVENYEEVKSAKIIIFKDTDEIIKSINNKEVDLLMLPSSLYVMEEEKLNIEPLIISKNSDDLYFSLLLCSTPNQKIEKFADLKNKTILVQSGKFKRISELWLDLLCLQVGEKDKYSFFKKIEFVEKPMQAVLPVFFNKWDACIVTNVSLDAITEMNPQIQNSLKIVFQREKLLNEMICVRKDLDNKSKEIIRNRGLDYKSLPNGEQIFKIFKTLGSSVYKPTNLEGVRSLWSNYKKLKFSDKN